MKTKTLVIALVMFLGLSVAAFAQATYSVGSIPVTAVINTGQVEKTGDITFNQVSGTSNTGTITISYGVPITNVLTGVTVGGVSGGYTTVNTTINTAASSNASGLLVVNVPSGQTTGSFTITGVRVAVAGTTLTSLSANISGTNNAITAGQTSVIVISSISPGISEIAAKKSGSATGSIAATNGTINTQPVITVTEGFLNAWGDANLAASTAAGLRITMSAAPPAGVTITFPATGTTNGTGSPTFTTINSDGTALGTTVAFTSASTTLTVYYRANTTTDPTKQEILTISPTLSVATTGVTYPLPSTNITYLVSMAPIGTAFDANNAVITTAGLIPRYAAADVGPKDLLTIVGSQTTLLIPFAQTVSAAGYDTGLAIANTTTDPGKTAMGFNTAVKQSGTIKFYLYPKAVSGVVPTAVTYTTSATSPGAGLDASGNLPSGSTYVVLLSQLLSAAGASADFTGYIFVITNFADAHALYVVSNFTTFSQGALAGVVIANRDVATESLGQ